MTTTMRFPTVSLLDPDRCYRWLVEMLHPDGLQCPESHPLPNDQAPHDRHRAPILDYECRQCGRVFNVFTMTWLNGIRYSCAIIVEMMKGFWTGVPTFQLADELGIDYGTLLGWRHDVHEVIDERCPPSPLPDRETEGDERFQNAGEKGVPHRDPDDPPRRRGNKTRGQGTFDNDRPPIVGLAGRTSGPFIAQVVHNADQDTCGGNVEANTRPDVVFHSDASNAYGTVAATGRDHHTVQHSPPCPEYARDDDGDGINEVHCNTCEGHWTGVRNFLRVFRGVSKWFLFGYVALYECARAFHTLTPHLLAYVMRSTATGLRPMPPLRVSTPEPP